MVLKNFVFSLVDTKDKSLPAYMSGEHLLLIASLVEKVKADLVMMIYGFGFNKRFGTSNLIICIFDLLGACFWGL